MANRIMRDKIALTFLLGAAVLVAGCATSRSEIKLAAPEAAKAAYPVTKAQVVLVRTVTDERVFEEAPSDPSVPSLGHEGSAAATADIKARAFARKRNTFGKALGDVLLESGQTVTGIVRDNVVAAFRQAGYRTTTDPAEAGASPITADVHIKQFWAWFTPGFWAITIDARIETTVDTGTAAPLVVKAQAKKSALVATDSDWMEIIHLALANYREQLAAQAAKLP